MLTNSATSLVGMLTKSATERGSEFLRIPLRVGDRSLWIRLGPYQPVERFVQSADG
jgi:hypothetical protein